MIFVKNSKSSQAGFTLLELIVVIGILAGAVFIVGMFGLDISTFGVVLGETFSAQSEIQTTLNEMIIELRSATQSVAGSYPVEIAGADALVFFSDTDGDDIPERVRYFVQGRVFKKGIIKASGIPLGYNPADEKIKDLVHNLHMESKPVFSYYNENYTGSQSPMSSPANIAEVRFVTVNLIADSTPENIQSRVGLSAGTMLRNLKTN